MNEWSLFFMLIRQRRPLVYDITGWDHSCSSLGGEKRNASIPSPNIKLPQEQLIPLEL